MRASLDDPLSKLGRAVTHYLDLRELHGGTDRKFRTITAERVPNSFEFHFRVGEVEPIDPIWNLIVGDAYHNLRSALDQLVYQLHIRHFKGNIPVDAERDSMFPVARTKPQPLNPLTTRKSICRLSYRDKKAIEFLQWYRGWGTSYPPDRNIWQLRRAIYDIDRLDIIDKHRRIHVSTSCVQAVMHPRFESFHGFHGVPRFGQELRSGAVVDVWSFTKEPSTDWITGYEKSGVATAASILLEGRRLEVIPHIGGCILAVKAVIDRFANRFPAPTVDLDLSLVHRVD